MKLTRRTIISAISAITALSVAVTAICVANNRPETVIEYKIEDNFEIMENMSVSFGEGGFTYDEFWEIPGDNWLDPVYSDNTEQTPSFYAEDYAGYTSDTEPMQVYEDMLVSYTGTEETVVIPDYVREISGHSFDGNWYVRCVILPVSVTALNMDALAGALNLTEVVYLGTTEQWSNVYIAPGAIPAGVSVIFAAPSPETEETYFSVGEPTEEFTDESTEETAVPAEEVTDESNEETTAPAVEDTDESTEETTVPAEEDTDESTEETTVPAEEVTDESTEETTAPAEEDTDESTEETTAPAEEATDESTEETTAPAEGLTDESTEETTVPVEEPVTEDTTSDTTVYSPVIPEYIPLASADAADFTTESIPVTPENDKTDETTLPSAAEEDAGIPDEETDSVSEPESESKPESEPEPEEAQTEPEAPKQKTISLVSRLSGLNGGKTKIAARMSYFPTSAVVSITNSEEAENTASQLGFDGAYYAFEVDVSDADTGELIPSLNGNITIDIGVPAVLSESANIYAYHIADGVPELIPCGFVMSSDGIRMVQFAASAFSPFVLTDHEFIAPQETIAENLPLTDETEQAVEDETSENSNNYEEAAGDNESLDEDSNTEDNDDINEDSNAEENDDVNEGSDTEEDNDVDEEPIIKVTFPSSASFIINPYKLDIQVNETETSNAPVISPEISVTSESNCKIAVYMTATAYNIPDTVRYSDTYLTNGEEEKSIFMYAEAGHYNESTDSYSYTNYYNGTSGQIPVTSYGSVSGKLLELDAVEEGSSAEGRFRLFGQTYMPSYDLWKENETLDVLMVFRVETVSDNIQELQ